MPGNPDIRARPWSVAIIGGGISGLAAAFLLRDSGLAVTVLEGSPRLGGELAGAQGAGIPVRSGAEARPAPRPEGTRPITKLGVAGAPPGARPTSAGDWAHRGVRPRP